VAWNRFGVIDATFFFDNVNALEGALGLLFVPVGGRTLTIDYNDTDENEIDAGEEAEDHENGTRLLQAGSAIVTLKRIMNYHLVNSAIAFNQLSCTGNNRFIQMRRAGRSETRCRINTAYAQKGTCNTESNLPRFINRDILTANGNIHSIDRIMLPSPDDTIEGCNNNGPGTCMCNTGCFGGLQMTYNRRKCNRATTQTNNGFANNYCEDFTTNPSASLPTGNVRTQRLTIGLYYCDGSANPFPLRYPNDTDLLGSRNMITDNETFDLNVRNVQTTIPVPDQAIGQTVQGFLGVCLPDCIQVRLYQYDSTDLTTEYYPLQTFNIDTRCAGNSLVSRTNYGAFYYREDFNVQCPVGKR
jgi:hypothetical protein